jgi:hypothetical protein
VLNTAPHSLTFGTKTPFHLALALSITPSAPPNIMTTLENGALSGSGVRSLDQNRIRFFKKIMSASPAISEKTLV